MEGNTENQMGKMSNIFENIMVRVKEMHVSLDFVRKNESLNVSSYKELRGRMKLHMVNITLLESKGIVCFFCWFKEKKNVKVLNLDYEEYLVRVMNAKCFIDNISPLIDNISIEEYRL